MLHVSLETLIFELLFDSDNNIDDNCFTVPIFLIFKIALIALIVQNDRL